MSLQLTSLGIDASDPLALARFWAVALGWEAGSQQDDSVTLSPTDGTRFTITFHPTPSSEKLEKNRIHLDLTTRSADDQRDSVDRLIALGASRTDVGQGPDAPHIVLSDSEGNEFCVIEPQNSFLSTCDRLGSITCDGSPEVGAFWSHALDWPLVWDQDDETAIRAPDGIGPFITWGPPVQPKVMRNRFHLELETDDASPSNLERLVSLGARIATTQQADGESVLMLDPDGNEFLVHTQPRRESQG